MTPKRSVALFLILTILFSFAACQKEEKTPAVDDAGDVVIIDDVGDAFIDETNAAVVDEAAIDAEETSVDKETAPADETNDSETTSAPEAIRSLTVTKALEAIKALNVIKAPEAIKAFKATKEPEATPEPETSPATKEPPIPASALADETFAALLKEAEKYLGYPYVWGGSNPDTSFDCSGFVSYVLTNSGVCNIGRLGSQGLYNISTPVSVSNAKPGDLVFFIGTYDASGVSHVGIYVGNNMMIHCSSQMICYSNLKDSYWQEHFYAFGRPPYN